CMDYFLYDLRFNGTDDVSKVEKQVGFDFGSHRDWRGNTIFYSLFEGTVLILISKTTGRGSMFAILPVFSFYFLFPVSYPRSRKIGRASCRVRGELLEVSCTWEPDGRRWRCSRCK